MVRLLLQSKSIYKLAVKLKQHEKWKDTQLL